MFNEARDILNKNLFEPLLFMGLLLVMYFLIGSFLYYRFLRWIPEKLATLVGALGAFFLMVQCLNHNKEIIDLIAKWSAINVVLGIIVVIIVIIMAVFAQGQKGSVRLGNKKNKRSSNTISKSRRKSTECRPDDVILCCAFEELSGPEFERLLALYFRDQGYMVQEVGIGGNDGGVDLVITDHRGEKTAVQAKCYAERNSVGVQTIRELVGAKRNHDCILSLLITTSDLTVPAKKEAEQFKVDYWHGALVEQKLRSWGKWQPGKKMYKPKEVTQPKTVPAAESKTAAPAATCSSCGSKMIVRKSREGKSFLGCSSFPKCRQTRAL
jgi:restriction system protein